MADFKVVKQVTIPFIVPPENHDPVYVRFITPFAADDSLALARKKRGEDKDAPKKPPMIAQVVNLETNTRAKLIGNQVVVSTLNESYPKDGYVNKSFQLRRMDKIKSASGNQYYAFEISEIEVVADGHQSTSAKSATKK